MSQIWKRIQTRIEYYYYYYADLGGELDCDDLDGECLAYFSDFPAIRSPHFYWYYF